MSDNLSTPKDKRRRQVVPRVDGEAFGKLAEAIARFLGTSRFLAIQTVVVLVWITYNVTIFKAGRFDVYPFILLNLAFSTQAAYAAPLILLAQNRQDDRDRANLLEDRDRALRSLADTEFLARELADIRLSLGEVVTRDYLRNELRELLADLDAQASGAEPRRRDSARREGKSGKKKKRTVAAGESGHAPDVGGLRPAAVVGEAPVEVGAERRPATDAAPVLDDHPADTHGSEDRPADR